MTDLTTTDNGQSLAPAVQSGAELWKFAEALSRADIIPATFRGKTANCFIALDMSKRMGVGFMEIMQNLYIVHGTPGFSAKYGIAMAQRSGLFKGGIHFDWTPSPASVTAWAILKETDQRVEFTVDMAMARAEKWDKNPKYKTMPQLMLSYRASSLLIRLYAPSALLGMQTMEELQDVQAAQTGLPQIVMDDDPIAKRNAVLDPEIETDTEVADEPVTTNSTLGFE